MSINLCALNTSSVDSICSTRRLNGKTTRQVVLDNLIRKADLLRKRGGTGSTYVTRAKDLYQDKILVDLNPELDEITVIVEFEGRIGRSVQANKQDFTQFVYVDDFDLGVPIQVIGSKDQVNEPIDHVEIHVQDFEELVSNDEIRVNITDLLVEQKNVYWKK